MAIYIEGTWPGRRMIAPVCADASAFGVSAIIYCGCVWAWVAWCLWCRGGKQICLHLGALGLQLQLNEAFAVVAVATATLSVNNAVVNLIILRSSLKRGGQRTRSAARGNFRPGIAQSDRAIEHESVSG